MSNLVTLKVDGVPISVPKGTLIVEAAKKVDNQIPVFCYHSKLEPVGMCRMCLVTVGTPVTNRETGKPELDEDGKPRMRFFPKPMTACTTPVSPGMEVITQSEESIADRTAVLEFLLTSHPLDCPICDKGGECPLQDLTYAHGPGQSRFPYEAKHHGPKKVELGDLIYLDTERCVMCARCVRFQDELAGDPVLAIENRGREAMIVSYSSPKFDSKFSGNTSDICPVGALTTRDFRFGARPWELKNIPSVCNHCGVGCNTVLGTRREEIKRIMPRQNEAVNEIWICDKGRFGHHFNSSQARLTTPLIKKNGRFVPATWGEALELVCKKLEFAGAAAGGIAGAHLSNEDLYTFQKLFREVLSSKNIDHRIGLNAHFDDEITIEVGAGVGTDIGRLGSGTTILNVGADLDEEAPVLYLRVRTAARHGAHLINAGGRWTKLDSAAQTSLRYHYGSATHLVWSMVAVVLEEGLQNKEFIQKYTQGLDQLQKQVGDYAPAKVADIIGLTVEEIQQAARTFVQAENGLILYGQEAVPDLALQYAIRTLLLVTGHVGRANNGAIAILPHVNSRGAADLGVVPHREPGYQQAYGYPGASAEEMLGEKSELEALYIVAADPAAESDLYKATIDKIAFVVVQELFMTETAKLADVVLPAKGVAERDGTYTSLERWVQAFDIGTKAPPQAWADWSIITAIAGQLGADWTYASADGVMADITRDVPLYAEMNFTNLLAPIPLARRMSHYIYSGMSFTSESREGLQWKPLAQHAEAVFPLEFVPPMIEPIKEGLIMVAPRVLYDAGTLLNQAEVVTAHIQPPQAMLSQTDAERLGVNTGDQITLTANDKHYTLPAHVNRLVPAGIILVPRNLSGYPAERLLNGKPVFTAVEVSLVSQVELA